jgi:hypothetical protein
MKKFTLLLIVTAVCLMCLSPGHARVTSRVWSQTHLAPVTAPAFKNPKIEASLLRLVQASLSPIQGQAARMAKSKTQALNADNTVRVVLETQTGLPQGMQDLLVPYISQLVASLGGRVETTHRNLVQASVPVSALLPLAGSPTVRFVRRPLVPRLLEVTSEGVTHTGADAWIKLAPFHAKPVKICILDLGFQGYSGLKGSELPSDVVTKSFRDDGDIEAGIVHGAACAEIVHDMAPDAKLYLVNFNSDVEQHNAVDWIIDQGVNVISYSIGWTNAGAGDGTGPIDADVDHAAEHHIVWASSAGNYATDHYEGAFSDPDSDGWDNFSGTDEILDFEVPAYTVVDAALNWDDWGTWNGIDYSGATNDYDLYLYIWDGASWVLVDSSTNAQNGGGDWPVEEIYGWYADITTHWGVAIHKVHATRNCKLELFTFGNSSAIEYNVPWGSLSIPGDSPNAVTAGAVSWSNDAYHYYSSRGPTHDGRIKPDFGAPSGVSTETYGNLNFYGTSASAPHVAGAFGLMMGRTPYTPDQIYHILQVRAVDLGTPGKDNMFGWGSLNLKK